LIAYGLSRSPCLSTEGVRAHPNFTNTCRLLLVLLLLLLLLLL
jgi:hypothetical protein